MVSTANDILLRLPISQAMKVRSQWLLRIASRAFLDLADFIPPGDGVAKVEGVLAALSLSLSLEESCSYAFSNLLTTSNRINFVQQQIHQFHARLDVAASLLEAVQPSIKPPSLIKVDLSWQAVRAVSAELVNLRDQLHRTHLHCAAMRGVTWMSSLPGELESVRKKALNLATTLKTLRDPLRERFRAWRDVLMQLREAVNGENEAEPKQVRMWVNSLCTLVASCSFIYFPLRLR